MEVDPRLQLSDLTDYQFQSSLAQYNAYGSDGGGRNRSRSSQNAAYFQTVPIDETRRPSRMSSRDSTQSLQEQINGHFLSGIYQGTSIPASSRGFNPGRPTQNNSSSNSDALAAKELTAAKPFKGSATVVRADSQPDKAELKDPTVFVQPHLLASMKPNPPSLKEWRNKFFNIDEPLMLSAEQYLTYFPHVDNVYSHRSTQKYKRKPFVSHYWDCRLKGRPTGTPMNKSRKVAEDGQDQEKKKRKRKVRERDLCDVKIKVTEFFGTDELEALRKLGLGPDANSSNAGGDMGDLTFVLNGNQQTNDQSDSTFGVLEPAQNYPPGHPGYGGKKWYMVQRVSGNEKDGEEPDDKDLDHKHTLEESDRIKKNSVQRWLLGKEKEKKKAAKADKAAQASNTDDDDNGDSTPSSVPSSRLHATGFALQTLYSHSTPTNNQLTFFASSFCPFAQRIWIALEWIGIPYQYVEVTEKSWERPQNPSFNTAPKLAIPELQECNPEGKVPCLKHNNFAVWESLVVLEYLEDLGMGQSLFQPAVGNAQLKAHSRLWVDFINRRILPVFYALLLLPDTDGPGSNTTDPGITPKPPVINLAGQHAHSNPDAARNGGYNDESYGMPIPPHGLRPTRQQRDPSTLPPHALAHPSSQHSARYNLKLQTLLTTLHTTITTLVNASHRTGPFFLGPILSYVDITFAPFIIRLSRVLSYYRGFPRPEVGTRWQAWCDAIESHEVIRRTVSDEQSYRDVYKGVDVGFDYDQWGKVDQQKAWQSGTAFPEMAYARKVVDTEGFGLGGDIWGQMAGEKGW